MNSLDDYEPSNRGAEARTDGIVHLRQIWRRMWERSEFAFFLGLMITMMLVGLTVMATH